MSFSELLIIDYIVVIILGISTVLAFSKGFIASVVSFTGWLLCIALTYNIVPIVEPYLVAKLQDKLAADLFAYFSILMFLLLSCSMFNMMLLEKMSSIRNGFIDKSLGSIFGLFRGIVIISFFYFCVILVSSIMSGKEVDDSLSPTWISEAKTYKVIKGGKNIVQAFIPDSLAQKIHDLHPNLRTEDINDTVTSGIIKKLTDSIDIEKLQEIDLLAEKESAALSNIDTQKNRIKRIMDEYLKNNPDGGEEIEKLRTIVEDTLEQNKS